MKCFISIILLSLLLVGCGVDGEDVNRGLSSYSKAYIDQLCDEAYPIDYDLFEKCVGELSATAYSCVNGDHPGVDSADFEYEVIYELHTILEAEIGDELVDPVAENYNF